MPHTSTAKKRLRQNVKRKLYNRTVKKQIKVQVKQLLEAIKVGTPEQGMSELRKTVKKLDNAAAKKVIHANTAARKKSQLAKLVNQKTNAAKDHTAHGPA